MEQNDRSLCVSPWIYSTSDIDKPALVPLLNTNTREIHVSVHLGMEHWDTGRTGTVAAGGPRMPQLTQ